MAALKRGATRRYADGTPDVQPTLTPADATRLGITPSGKLSPEAAIHATTAAAATGPGFDIRRPDGSLEHSVGMPEFDFQSGHWAATDEAGKRLPFTPV